MFKKPIKVDNKVSYFVSTLSDSSKDNLDQINSSISSIESNSYKK